MSDVDMAWDEDRGGPRHADNLVSFPEDGEFYLSTKNVLDWRKCGVHDTARMVVPAVFVEKLFKLAPVKDPTELQEHLFLVKTLAIAWLEPALELLLGQGCQLSLRAAAKLYAIVSACTAESAAKASAAIVERSGLEAEGGRA